MPTSSTLPRLNAGYLLAQVALPLIVGGGIYICWRVDHLFMFHWFDLMGLTTAVEATRAAAMPLRPHLPDWWLFSVPDGAWVYASVAFFGRLWRDGPLWAAAAWTGIGPALAIGGELGQIPGWVPGTFDWVDVAWYVGAAGVALLFAIKPWHGGTQGAEPDRGEAEPAPAR